MNVNRHPAGNSIHADFHPFILGSGTMEADFDLIEIDMNDFLAIRADLRHLAIEIDGIPTARTACDDDPDDLCLLLHGR